MQRIVLRMAVTAALLLSTAVGLQADAPTTLRGAETVGDTVVPYVFDGDVRNLPTPRQWQPGDPIKEVPRRHTSRPTFEPEVEASGIDPLVDRQRQAPAAEPLAFGVPILNIPGQGFTGVNPPDTVGDAGPSHYVQAINAGGGSRIIIYDKLGVQVAGPFQLDSLGAGNCAFGAGDPIVLYDRLADRWMLSEFSGGGNRLCVYISQTSNPVAGGWFNYDFQAPSFPDYPKYGVWHDAYYVGSNENLPAAYALDRVNMLTGAPARPHQRFTAPNLGGFGFQAMTPADHDGPSAPPGGAPGIFMRHNDDEAHTGSPVAGSDFLELFFFSVDFNNAGNSTFTGPVKVSIAEIDSTLCGLFSFSCFDQPGGGANLDPLREVVMFRLQYVNYGSHEALIGNLVTDVSTNQGGVRWFELRKTTGNWGLFQEGTYSIDSADRWMGAISQDKMGNIAVGYNVVDDTANVFPGIRYSGRLATDPAGTLPQGEHSIIEGTARNGSNRYGDYSSMSLDPSDDCTFWFTGEYNVASGWSTRIGAVKFDNCGGPPPAAPTIQQTGGSCPGNVNISGANFAPNQEVALVEAANLNGFVKGGSLCPGTQFEIGEPLSLPPNFVFTDGSGNFSTSITTTSGRCFVEGIDLLATCQTSQAIDTSP